MRMIVLLTASAALLCGVSIGMMVGLALGYWLFKRHARAEPDPDFDYSGWV